MQDEINERIVVFSIRTAKLTGDMVIEAARQYLSAKKTPNSNIRHGRQTLKQLIGQNAGASSVEVSKQNIKTFESVAKKYGIDYAVEKIKTDKEIRHLVFFKGRDADAVTAALTELSSMKLTQKPSVRAMLNELTAQIKPPEMNRDFNLVQAQSVDKER